MIFYIGLHHEQLAQNFDRCFISANVLRRRKSDFLVNNWIMDSGAFTELSLYGGYRFPVDEYAKIINRWSSCGKLEAAICQDYMCEPFMLSKTGLTIKEHQILTIQRYDALLQITTVYIMPVLQGYEPKEYVEHLKMYGERLTQGMRVGVGSVCKRNSNPQAILSVLQAITEAMPGLKLHGFGLKSTSLADNLILSMLYSADSMAWSYRARREGRNANGLSEALEFYNRINEFQGRKDHQYAMQI